MVVGLWVLHPVGAEWQGDLLALMQYFVCWPQTVLEFEGGLLSACVAILDVTLLPLRTSAAWVESKSVVCWKCGQSLHAW